MKVYFLLLFFLFCSLINCRLQVISPQSTKDSLPEGIEFQITRFGKIPFGSRLTGTLFLADPFDLCSKVKSNSFLLEKAPIFITRDDGCKYTVKAMNAQLVGAKMLIIVDKFDKLPKNPVGHYSGADIRIPTIIVPFGAGSKLFFDTNKPSDGESRIQIAVNFPSESISEKILFQYFFSSADSTNSAFKFIKGMKDFYLQAQDSFDFEPHYVTWSYAPQYKRNDDCLSDGRYCAPDPDYEGPLQGADVVMENLKQICIWRTSPEKWWNYMERFEKCINNQNQQLCSDLVLQDIGLNRNGLSSIKNCVESSFRGHGTDKKIIDNFILKEEKQIQDDYEISTFPTLFINYKRYTGNIGEPEDVIQSLCESSKNPPKICSKYSIIVYNLQKEDELRNNLTVFVITLVMITLLIFLFYRRVTKREMTKNMPNEIGHAVSQYLALVDLNETKNIQDSI